ncbi:hypothetical protein [Yaniella halotolerans]|uniref:hypothetical protein n=1 Tax=Yaniella halotolerans TaxID=225453 RepID=UPI0003B62107|nr:hypothetical protein [Yaniella halotolerans]
MKRRIISTGIVLLVVLGGIIVWFVQDGDFSRLIGAMVLIFLAAVALGIIIRFIRAKPGERMRQAFGPIIGAGDSYQSLLLGRPTVEETSTEAQRIDRVNTAFDDPKEDPR